MRPNWIMTKVRPALKEIDFNHVDAEGKVIFNPIHFHYWMNVLGFKQLDAPDSMYRKAEEVAKGA